MTKKTFLIYFLTLSIALVPLYSASASIWSDVMDYFSSNQEEKEVQEEKKEKFTQEDKDEAQRKYDLWSKAYEKKDSSVLRNEPEVLTFTEREMNYLAKKKIKDQKETFLTDPEIDLKPGAVEVKGYLLKPLTGESFLRAELNHPEDKQLDFKVVKSRYRGFYFPSIVANKLIDKHGQEVIGFFNSVAIENNLNLRITENKMEFY